MQVKEEKYDVGVIVGRFQVADLHDAHIALIQTVCERHDKVIIFLGLAPIFDSRNPLDFEARKHMIQARFPDILVSYIADTPDDSKWSGKLDAGIQHVVPPGRSVVLYGSRDSFLPHYTGKYPTRELVQERWISGSEMRSKLRNTVGASRDFRHGAIWAMHNIFDTVYPTVDMVVWDQVQERIILGRKPGELLWRLPGGFADPKRDESYEQAAVRELGEELPNIDIGGLSYVMYIGSKKINDWRYRNSPHKVITHLYACRYFSGAAIPGDDLSEAAWFYIAGFPMEQVLEGHKILLNMFFQWLKVHHPKK